MSAKHTPGPWGTLTFSNHELQTDFAMVKIGSRAHMVGYSGEDKANARLIAAAPDMLAALQACHEAMSYMSEYDIPLTLPGQVKAAIAKAIG